MRKCNADNPFQSCQDGSREAWRYDHEREYHADHAHVWDKVERYGRILTACTVCDLIRPYDYKESGCNA